MKKFDCYKCTYKDDIAGNAHICCRHPEIEKNPKMEYMAMLGIARTPSPAAQKLVIRGSQHGIDNGWFMWPAEFDPVWLENCEGFEEKGK